MDLAQQFQRLVQMMSADMKKVGDRLDEARNHIGQIVAKITQLDQRLTALERRAGGAVIQAPVVNGQVVNNGQANSEPVVDATPLWRGDPDAFFKGDDES